MKWTLRLLLALLCVVAAVACGDSPAPSSGDDLDEIDYQVFPTTRVLSAADLASLQTASEDGTLVFDPAPSSLAGVETGMVLVGGATKVAPQGVLRGVGDVVREGNRLTLRTMVVPIQVAFRRLSARTRHRIPDIAAAEVKPGEELAPRAARIRPLDTNATAKKSLRWVLFDGDGDEATVDDQVRLEGELGGGFFFDARFEIDWGAVDNLPQTVADCLKSIPGILIGKLPDCTPLALLPEAKATFEVGPDLSAHADLIGSASLEFEKQIQLISMGLAPITIGPLVIVPGVDVIATLNGSAGARFKTGFDADLSARMDLTASTKNGVGVSTPRLERSDVKARATELAIMAKGRVSLGARISMTVYGILGPYAQVNGYAELAADTSKDPCWDIRVGLSANAGILLTTPRLPVLGVITLFDLKTPTLDLLRSGPLASGSCSFGKGSTLPGAGPDEQRYGKPEFPTWSNVATLPGEPFWATGAGGTSDIAFTQMDRTTDGRFLTSASGSRRLRKIDETGREIWARSFAAEGGAFPLSLGRVATMRDSSIVVATTSPDGAPAALRIGQAGGVFSAMQLGFDASCIPGPITGVHAMPLPSDDLAGTSHFVATGECRDTGGAYLALLTSSGRVVSAKTITVPAPSKISPRALALVDGSLWWLGVYVLDGIAHVAAIRLDASLATQASSAYVGTCENNRRIEPALARPAALRSELLVAGSSAGNHEGLILRLRPDASIAFATFPTFGPGASEVSVIHAIAELPTTGYVIAGSHQSYLAPEGSPYRTAAPYLGWIDAGGRVLAARRFVLDGGAVTTTAPHVALTDDGGLMMAATRFQPGQTSHDLWTMKAFAKDGSVADPRVQSAPFPLDVAGCNVAQAPLPVTMANLGVTTKRFTVTTTP
ncbi:MAG: hypothetical protein JST00_04995 [Deltaproteobacteria bacterium]|nr:hypothetical protein [Deltaproteobacteria bacterium]